MEYKHFGVLKNKKGAAKSTKNCLECLAQGISNITWKYYDYTLAKGLSTWWCVVLETVLYVTELSAQLP